MFFSICIDGIEKKSDDIKKVIFKIPKPGNGIQYIQFRYGVRTFIPPSHVIYSCLFGLILALPNLIMFYIRKKKTKMSASRLTLFMNIFLNVTYGNLLGYLIGIGGYYSLELGKNLFSLYVIVCIVQLILQLRSQKRGYFDVIYNLCHKINDSKTLLEIVNYNRKVPPKIVIGCYADHEESRQVWIEYELYSKPVYESRLIYDRYGYSHFETYISHYVDDYRYYTTHYSKWGRVENGGGKFYGIPGSQSSRYDKSTEYKTVETWREEKNYEYKSWEDETGNIYDIEYFTIIDAVFITEIYLDKKSENNINDIKNKLIEFGKTQDTNVHSYVNYTIPQLISKHTCILNDYEYQKIKKKYCNFYGYFCWFVTFILSYSSLFEFYARYEVGTKNISIIKRISSKNDKRAVYLCNDENIPNIHISYISTKLQKAQELKKEKKKKKKKKEK